MTEKYGFDITDFGSAYNWAELCSEINLKFVRQEASDTAPFIWANSSGLTVYTQNNPKTGKYAQPDRREDEEGFASYIGAEGPRAEIVKFVAAVRKYAVFVKGSSPWRRDFI